MRETLKDKLKVVTGDKLLLEALQTVFNDRVEQENPSKEGDDLLLGQKYRAYLKAKDIIKKAFDDLQEFSLTEKTRPLDNRGR